MLDSGKFGCNSCGYVYDQDKGDPSYPVAPGELTLLKPATTETEDT